MADMVYSCWMVFKQRSAQYKLGVVFTYVGLAIFVLAFSLPEWFTYPLPREVWGPEEGGGTKTGGGGVVLVNAGLWQVCVDGASNCHELPRHLFPAWLAVSRVFLAASLACYVSASLLVTLHLCQPSLLHTSCALLTELLLVSAGVSGMTGVCVLGSRQKKSLSGAWMLALVASLLTFLVAINLFQGRHQADDLPQHTILPGAGDEGATDEELNNTGEGTTATPVVHVVRWFRCHTAGQEDTIQMESLVPDPNHPHTHLPPARPAGDSQPVPAAFFAGPSASHPNHEVRENSAGDHVDALNIDPEDVGPFVLESSCSAAEGGPKLDAGGAATPVDGEGQHVARNEEQPGATAAVPNGHLDEGQLHTGRPTADEPGTEGLQIGDFERSLADLEDRCLLGKVRDSFGRESQV